MRIETLREEYEAARAEWRRTSNLLVDAIMADNAEAERQAESEHRRADEELNRTYFRLWPNGDPVMNALFPEEEGEGV